jgi:hypothetical protein
MALATVAGGLIIYELFSLQYESVGRLLLRLGSSSGDAYIEMKEFGAKHDDFRLHCYLRKDKGIDFSVQPINTCEGRQ